MKYSKCAALTAKWVVVALIALTSSACSSLPFYRSEEPEKFAYDVKKLEAPQPPAIDVAKAEQTRLSGLQASKSLWSRLREGMKLEHVESPVTEKYVAYYSSHPELINRVFLKAAPFLDYILSEVEQRHMPTEIALLPFIESGFDPLAVSRTGATGLWQFTASTGKYYRLRQSRAYDARSDIVSSTNAALDYLQDLYLDMHGNWLMALASYNGGPGYVKRTAKRLGQPLRTVRFEDMIHLRNETRNYVPKLIAISKIIQSPDTYNVKLPEMATHKIITVKNFDYPVDLHKISRQTGVNLNTLKALNPGIRHSRVSGKGKLALALPRNEMPATTDTIKTAGFEPAVSSQHPVRLAAWQPAVARQTTAASSAVLNSHTYLPPNASYSATSNGRELRRAQPVHNDMVVAASRKQSGEAPRMPAGNTSGRSGSSINSYKSYRITAGDTLSEIAARYATSVTMLKKINHLSSSLILAGATLKIPLSQTRPDTVVARKALPAKPANRRSVTYRVGEGDTLDAIAEHYGIDSKDILMVNGAGHSNKLVAGQLLTLYPSEAYFAERDQAPRMVKIESYDFSETRRTPNSTADTGKSMKPVVSDGGFRAVLKYRVGPGDTLLDIARHYHIPVRELSVWNELKHGIAVGQTLEIPPSI